jgi:secretion/DNA translocation related TadE-like protein
VSDGHPLPSRGSAPHDGRMPVRRPAPGRGPARAERGAVTAELAIAMPALVLLLATMLATVTVAMNQMRCIDAARAAARAAARNETAASVVAIGRAVGPPDSRVTVTDSGGRVVVTVSASVGLRLPGSPGVRVESQAVAVREVGGELANIGSTTAGSTTTAGPAVVESAVAESTTAGSAVAGSAVAESAVAGSTTVGSAVVGSAAGGSTFGGRSSRGSTAAGSTGAGAVAGLVAGAARGTRRGRPGPGAAGARRSRPAEAETHRVVDTTGRRGDGTSVTSSQSDVGSSGHSGTPHAPLDRSRRDRGAGTILVIGLVNVLVALTGALVLLGQVMSARHQAAAAADLAALAAARVATEPLAGPGDDPCAVAATVAAGNRAQLTSCTLDPAARVTVRVRTGAVPGAHMLPITAEARAGPAEPPGTIRRISRAG